LNGSFKKETIERKQKEFLDEFKEKASSFKVVDVTTYKNNKTPIEILHDRCGYTFERSKNNFFRHYNEHGKVYCPICDVKSGVRLANDDEFKKRIEWLSKGEYTF